MNPSLSPDQPADLVIKGMTLDEKIALVTGYLGYPTFRNLKVPERSLGADGYVFGVPRLGIPNQQEIGSGLGVTDLGKRPHAEATAFPSGLAQAATWSLDLAYDVGVVIDRETRQQCFNVHLRTGVNLAREPPRRLVGWKKFELRPGETRHVQLTIDLRMLASFDIDANNWHVLPGDYQFFVGSSSGDLPLTPTSVLQE